MEERRISLAPRSAARWHDLEVGHRVALGPSTGAIDLDGDLTQPMAPKQEGSVTGRNVTVEGNVNGDVCAERAHCGHALEKVHRDVQAETLSIHPEASIKGHIAMRWISSGGLNMGVQESSLIPVQDERHG